MKKKQRNSLKYPVNLAVCSKIPNYISLPLSLLRFSFWFISSMYVVVAFSFLSFFLFFALALYSFVVLIHQKCSHRTCVHIKCMCVHTNFSLNLLSYSSFSHIQFLCSFCSYGSPLFSHISQICALECSNSCECECVMCMFFFFRQ